MILTFKCSLMSVSKSLSMLFSILQKWSKDCLEIVALLSFFLFHFMKQRIDIQDSEIYRERIQEAISKICRIIKILDWIIEMAHVRLDAKANCT